MSTLADNRDRRKPSRRKQVINNLLIGLAMAAVAYAITLVATIPTWQLEESEANARLARVEREFRGGR